MKILISMTDYILNLSTEYQKGKSLHNTDWSKEFEQFSKLVISYAEFLKQSLKLEMLFPCDEYGNVLEEPNPKEIYPSPTAEEEIDFLDCLEQYQQEKEKVLFEGFEFKEYERMICFEKKGIEIFIYNKNYQTFSAPRGRIITIEDLIIYEFELTESAVKQICL